jgi:hypothetical protein
MINELEWILVEAAVVWFKVLTPLLSGGAKEEKPYQDSRFPVRYLNPGQP